MENAFVGFVQPAPAGTCKRTSFSKFFLLQRQSLNIIVCTLQINMYNMSVMYVGIYMYEYMYYIYRINIVIAHGPRPYATNPVNY